MTRVVPGTRTLDLENLGAEVGKQLGAPWPGKYAAKVEDPDPLQRFQCRRLQIRRSDRKACAALCPGAPVTPPPGCAPDPHR